MRRLGLFLGLVGGLLAQGARGADKVQVLGPVTVRASTSAPVATQPNWPYDGISTALKFIDYEHHELHDGSFYRAGYRADVANGDTINVVIVTSTSLKALHLRPEVECELECTSTFFENPTSATGGTPIVPKNADRTSANTSLATLVYGATLNTTGAVVLGQSVNGSGKISGGVSSSSEWILKSGEEYVFTVLNNTTSNNQIAIRLQWYEHTPGNY